MKNRIIIFFTALLFALSAVLFASCAQDEADRTESSAEVSETQSAVNEESSESVSEASAESGEDAESVDNTSTREQSETEAAQSFHIESENGNYLFVGEEYNTGSYSCEFSAETNENGDITLTLADGRTMTLSITEVVYNEDDDIYVTAINGMEFLIEDSYTDDNKHYQVFECIEPIEGFYGKVISTIIITYYPEMEYGSLNIAFTYTSEGDRYILKYADGQTVEKVILFDEATETYYFAEESASED